MARKVRTSFLYVVASIVFCATLYHHFLRDAISAASATSIVKTTAISSIINNAVDENIHNSDINIPPRLAPQVNNTWTISTTSILIPDWEVLVIVSPEDTPLLTSNSSDYVCLYENNEVSPAVPAGVLRFPDRATFKCLFPRRARRTHPFKQPIFMKSTENPPERTSPSTELLRWTYIVYDSLTTDEDIVLFVKGVNNRQGTNREPNKFRCIFGDDYINGVRTAVTTSMQEVFRCKRPELTAVNSVDNDIDQQRIKVSLETVEGNRVVPSVAYYTNTRKLDAGKQKSLLCASTMVYNVGKFLKEWVFYHSRIGVEKFLLYDNGSDDDLGKVVEELVQEGFDVKTYFWLWPKTQEAGFSHSAIYAKESCTWMMFMDVDEFVYSPSWQNSPEPSKSMLHSLIWSTWSQFSSSMKISLTVSKVGQLRIECHEFGPSNHSTHPILGVTQGYNCRRKLENRHKSILLLEAVDDSLLNVIHHFTLKPGFRSRKLNSKNIVVNHYKYQAWPEFKAKFRRRVSTYVLDWTQPINPNSNDRTPGLGFTPVEPQDWPQKFCEVHDNGLKNLTRRWFQVESPSGDHQMSWQR
ncbi:glycosyltransferase family 92 RCOM_0530710-like [Olea europaea subsp. europaea]|uniref:Glycosyltransferase family 92 protein n=1 Tax=Olea europaea subsp. europaea TaxID=158383 RepID=A0A8S0T0B1_OLEEU|nr:glycosyltransferase family 92 RCOM_0530710-like [Olea europaea subsp. europaea]